MNINHKQQFKKIAAILGVVGILALLLNWVVLEIFGQESMYRAVHSLVGILFLIGFYFFLTFTKISKIKIFYFFLLSLIPCYLGTVWSDLDITIFGIGSHRNPLFHSGILYFILYLVVRRFKSTTAHTILSGFGVGLSSHLLWDLLDNADVRWIPTALMDQVWLSINGFACLIMARIQQVSSLKKMK